MVQGTNHMVTLNTALTALNHSHLNLDQTAQTLDKLYTISIFEKSDSHFK